MATIISSTLCKLTSFNHLSRRLVFKQMDNSLKRRYLFGVKSTANDSETQQKTNELNSSEADPQTVANEEISTKLNELSEENKKLIDLIKEIDDKYKRSLAEAENTRIRMRRQVEDAKAFGIQAFGKDLLEVADVLHLAVESVPANTITDDNKVLKNLFSGLEMTEKQLQTVFRRHGLTQINPIGEKFDPNSHQALFELAESDKEPGSVAVVTKIGYKLHDRTVRPAMVGVVKAK